MKSYLLLLLFLTGAVACNQSSKMDKTPYEWPEGITPPVAEIIPHTRSLHGDTVVDNYYWMIDFFKQGPHSDKVVEYLNAENAYVDAMMKGTETLQKSLFEEMKGRIKEKDESVPVFKNGYFYYTRTEDGKQYYKYCRRKGTMDAPEEILADVDEMAKGHSYFAAGGFNVSVDNRLMAFGVDTVSRRQFTLYIKNLDTGEIYPEKIENTTGGSVWANDNKTLFYTIKNEQTLLSEKIMRHVLSTSVEDDVVVYHEQDNTNYIGVGKSKEGNHILIGSGGTLSSEYRYIDANRPNDTFKVFAPRRKDVLYSVVPLEDKFLILTNWDAQNFRLMECPIGQTGEEHWKELVPHRQDVLLSELDVFKGFIVLSERKNGLAQIRIINRVNQEDHYLDFGEPAYDAYTAGNPEYKSAVLRYQYTSMTTPNSTFDYDMLSRKKELKKQQEVVGGYNSEEYLTERLYATSRDGKQVPISLVYKKGLKKDGNNPLLLYAYGSYGHSMDASFSSSRLSLLNRGFVFAIAHIRGGEEMGRQWYDDGKMMNKKNTFNDFVDCGRYLIDQKFTTSAHLYAQGGSAGGLLMGAVINQAPDLWNGVIADVPFVDVVNTMLDESIPLTTNEFDEWGNPKEKEAYDYIKSYSPYENIEAKAYPNLLITTGLHDSQVQYFEPAKWVAKLRATQTGDRVILLKTNMEAGHGGASGRFDYLKEVALEYAFLLSLEGISQ
jgi:oligopeptidase B